MKQIWVGLCFTAFMIAILVFCALIKSKIIGPKKPLSERRVNDSIDIIDYFPEATEFYENYVATLKPVVLKGILNKLRSRYLAYDTWSDKYLLDNYGSVVVEVERGKKENRRNSMRYMTFRDFLGAYKENDLYMVQNVPEIMEDDVLVFSTLLCGGFEKLLTESVIWFSSGGTKSLLHMDMLDNLNCLLDGKKDVLIFDQKYSAAIQSRGFVHEGGYSEVDVENVDLSNFPQFAGLSAFHTHLLAGDCLYIPYKCKQFYYNI